MTLKLLKLIGGASVPTLTVPKKYRLLIIHFQTQIFTVVYEFYGNKAKGIANQRRRSNVLKNFLTNMGAPLKISIY